MRTSGWRSPRRVILDTFLIDPARFTVTVKAGIVTIAGEPETSTVGRDIIDSIRHVDGVVAVRDRLSYPADEGEGTVYPARQMQPQRPAYALLGDGSTVLIRPAGPADFAAVKAMHEAMSPDNAYLRFFSASLLAAGRSPPGSAAADLGTPRCSRCPATRSSAAPAMSGRAKKAEVAFAVADRMHHMGVATLLLEHLVSRARDDGIEALIAEVLAENTAMLRVFAGAGLPVRRRSDDGVIDVTVPLPRDGADTALDAYLTAVARREGSADTASLQHLLAPRSVAVIGAGRRPGTAGRAILDNIRAGGYQGRLYAVNPHARHLGGVPCVPSVAELPEAPDLAVIAVPPAAVTGIAQACGTLGVKALAVITAGLDAGASADLLATCRRHGMRLAGPGSFGIAVPGAGLDATFAASHPRAGHRRAGGAVGRPGPRDGRTSCPGSASASPRSRPSAASSTSQATTCCCGGSTTGSTRLAILYIESFGNPRKFARTARRVAETMPVLTVHAGRSATSQHATADAGAATPPDIQQALFEQAGIITAPGLGELTEVTALLATQPVPRGRTVAIVSNVTAAAALAAARVRRPRPDRPPGARDHPPPAPRARPAGRSSYRPGRPDGNGNLRRVPPVPGAPGRAGGRRRHHRARAAHRRHR